MEANKIQVIDDQGNEKEFEVLFTFNNDELNNNMFCIMIHQLKNLVYLHQSVMMLDNYFN